MIIGITGYIGSGKDTVAKMIQYLMAIQDGSVLARVSKYDSFDYGGKISNWEVKKFAGKLKQIISLLTGISVEDLEKEEVKNSYLGNEWNRWNYINKSDGKKVQLGFIHYDKLEGFKSRFAHLIKDGIMFPEPMKVRELLQQLGTEACRDIIHPDIWVNALFSEFKPITCRNRTIYCSEDQEEVCHKGFNYGCYPNWLISDCRFPNEAKAIKDKGGIVIRVNRFMDINVARGIDNIRTEKFDIANKQHQDLYKGEVSRKHSSETSLDSWEFDYVIDNNYSIETLLTEVKIMLEHFKLWKQEDN